MKIHYPKIYNLAFFPDKHTSLNGSYFYFYSLFLIIVSVLCVFKYATWKQEKQLTKNNADFLFHVRFILFELYKCNRNAMNRNWSNQKANPALKTKTGNK